MAYVTFLNHIMLFAWMVAGFAAVGLIVDEIKKISSIRKVGGMTFIRFGPLSLSYCLTDKPIRKD